MTNPLDFTTRVNWVPAAIAGAVLFAGYVVGPVAAALLSSKPMRAVTYNLIEFPDLD